VQHAEKELLPVDDKRGQEVQDEGNIKTDQRCKIIFCAFYRFFKV
jgi:hypothetical protein